LKKKGASETLTLNYGDSKSLFGILINHKGGGHDIMDDGSDPCFVELEFISNTDATHKFVRTLYIEPPWIEFVLGEKTFLVKIDYISFETEIKFNICLVNEIVTYEYLE